MATLQLLHKGDSAVHEVTVTGWRPVEDEAGVVEATAVGGNVLLRFGSPGPDFRDEVPLHEGERRELELSGHVYARAFDDRPVGDF